MSGPSISDPFPRTRLTGAFERRVAAALVRAMDEMGAAGSGRVVVAASGGPDSTALLVALARSSGAGRVVAGHFDHRLRSPEEAERDRHVVREICEALSVECVEGQAPRRPSNGSEEAAREARYRWLARACRDAGAGVCVTGHTLDDQAETVLMRLTRGTGAGGAAGMSSSADWPVPGRGTRTLRVVRPLLGISRAEVERYLAALGITAAVDPSNDDLGYARNRMRHQVMPALRELNPRAAEQIARFASLQRADDDALQRWADEELARIAGYSQDRVVLNRSALRALPEAVRARCLRRAGTHLGLHLEGAQLDALHRMLGARGRRVDLGGGYARTVGETVELVRDAAA